MPAPFHRCALIKTKTYSKYYQIISRNGITCWCAARLSRSSEYEEGVGAALDVLGLDIVVESDEGGFVFGCEP